MTESYTPGEDPILDEIMDRWNMPDHERAEHAEAIRGTMAYQRAKLATAVGGLAHDTLDTIRRRIHRGEN